MNKHSLKHHIEYFILRTICGWIKSKPLPDAINKYKLLGKIWSEYLKIRKKETLDNLRHAFLELSEKEIEKLGEAVFYHFSRLAVEVVLLSNMIKYGFDNFIGESNWEVLENAHAEGRGVVFVSGHIGNWELLGTAMTIRGLPVWALVANIKNPLVDQFVYRHRVDSGMKIIRIKESRRMIQKGIKQGAIIIFVSDQDAGKNGIFVPFLGKPASTHTGAAVYALRYKVPLVYGMSYFKDKKYHFHFERFDGNSQLKFSRENIYKITEWYSKTLENDVRKYPEQYFWLHRRWKTRPESESSS